MSPPLIIALDAMGGDHGPQVVIGGAARALAAQPGLQYRLYGDEDLINRQLDRLRRFGAKIESHPIPL